MDENSSKGYVLIGEAIDTRSSVLTENKDWGRLRWGGASVEELAAADHEGPLTPR